MRVSFAALLTLAVLAGCSARELTAIGEVHAPILSHMQAMWHLGVAQGATCRKSCPHAFGTRAPASDHEPGQQTLMREYSALSND